MTALFGASQTRKFFYKWFSKLLLLTAYHAT